VAFACLLLGSRASPRLRLRQKEASGGKAFVCTSTSHSYFFSLSCTKELVATSGSERNWKGMAIAALVISVVMLLIFVAVGALSPEGGHWGGDGRVVPLDDGLNKRRVTLADFLSKRLDGKSFNGTWISGELREMSATFSELIT